MLFRKAFYQEGSGQGIEIMAVFPDLAERAGEVVAYAHVGQHFSVSREYVLSDTRPAAPSDYSALARELERIGYCLVPVEGWPSPGDAGQASLGDSESPRRQAWTPRSRDWRTLEDILRDCRGERRRVLFRIYEADRELVAVFVDDKEGRGRYWGYGPQGYQVFSKRHIEEETRAADFSEYRELVHHLIGRGICPVVLEDWPPRGPRAPRLGDAGGARHGVPPDWVWAYHATPEQFLPSIAVEGLRPSAHAAAGEEVLFVERTLDGLEPYYGPGIAVLRFKTPSFASTEDGEDVLFGGEPPFEGGPGGSAVPPDRIQILRDRRFIPLSS